MLTQPVVFRHQQGSVSEGISMQGLLGKVVCSGLGGLAWLNPDSVSRVSGTERRTWRHQGCKYALYSHVASAALTGSCP